MARPTRIDFPGAWNHVAQPRYREAVDLPLTTQSGKGSVGQEHRETLGAGAVGELSVPIVAIYPLGQRLPSRTHRPPFGSS
jgi:hypothetical protein